MNVLKAQTNPQDITAGLKSFSQYDFVPGDKSLFYEDFNQDANGEFPGLWTTNQSGEVNKLSVAEGKWFNLNALEGNWWLTKQIANKSL